MRKDNKPSFRKIQQHTFSGNKYRILWKNPGKRKGDQLAGLCDPPTINNKTITIDPNLSEKELLKTAVDESIHATCWPLDNEYVDSMSNSIGEFLWRMGYRLK